VTWEAAVRTMLVKSIALHKLHKARLCWEGSAPGRVHSADMEGRAAQAAHGMPYREEVLNIVAAHTIGVLGHEVGDGAWTVLPSIAVPVMASSPCAVVAAAGVAGAAWGEGEEEGSDAGAAAWAVVVWAAESEIPPAAAGWV